MNSLRNLVHPRDEIMQTMDRIYRYRMTTTSGGNLSIRDHEGNIWISPARVDKGNLTRQRHRLRLCRWNHRRTAPAIVGVSVSQSDLQGAAGHARDRSRAPRRLGRL